MAPELQELGNLGTELGDYHVAVSRSVPMSADAANGARAVGAAGPRSAEEKELDFAKYFDTYGAAARIAAAPTAHPSPAACRRARTVPGRLPVPPERHAAGQGAHGRVPLRDPSQR